MEIIPNLHFNGDCEKAIQLYKQVFKGEVTKFIRYKDANPRDMTDKLTDEEQEYIYHAEMTIGNQRIILNDTFKDLPYGINTSLLVTFDTPEEVKQAYEILKDDANIIKPMIETTYSSCFVSLVDRYGVRWELIKEGL